MSYETKGFHNSSWQDNIVFKILRKLQCYSDKAVDHSTGNWAALHTIEEDKRGASEDQTSEQYSSLTMSTALNVAATKMVLASGGWAKVDCT